MVLRPLSYALDYDDCPERIDDLIEKAATLLDDVRSRDDALKFAHRRCTDDVCREAIWRRRVTAFVAAAENEQEAIVRLSLRRQALEVADRSEIPELRQLAASELERAREDDLGMVRFGSSSHYYVEQFEQVRDSFISGTDWQQALIRFAHAGPLSGNAAANRAFVTTMRNENALSALFPVELFGPDNMPILRAITPEERFEYDFVRVEAQYTSVMAGPLVDALHEIVVRFGMPPSEDLTAFLASWPGMSAPAVHTIVRALQRFWSGDSEGATYTLVPRIEMMIRTLILATAGGIYRLQTTHAPGQYPGLGAMLGIVAERFDINESRIRFLRLTLTEPAGFNLRNTLSHGISDWFDPGSAAIAIHNVLFIATLKPVAEDPQRPTPGGADS
ncbi:hypothetical protein TUM20984_49920 [Mycobacterium antarcticum]|nr:hypothetical protein TUM20984_49920 [Mycolicibacterium sp. TUM20984]